MTSSAIVTREIVEPALDGICHNTHQARLIFNPSPEVDSLAERIAHLRTLGVPEAVVRDLFDDLRSIVASNQAERDVHRHVSRAGDDLARALGASQAGVVGEGVTVTGIKRLLGGPEGPLAVLAHPSGRTAEALIDARAAVAAVVERAPDVVLRRASLRNQLGARRHDMLLAFAAQREEAGNAS